MPGFCACFSQHRRHFSPRLCLGGTGCQGPTLRSPEEGLSWRGSDGEGMGLPRGIRGPENCFLLCHQFAA